MYMELRFELIEYKFGQNAYNGFKLSQGRFSLDITKSIFHGKGCLPLEQADQGSG